MWLRWSAVSRFFPSQQVGASSETWSRAFLGAAEHHVLEQVRKAGLTGLGLVARSGRDHHIQRHQIWVIRADADQPQAVGQVGANADRHWSDTARAAGRETLVINQDVIGQHGMAGAVHHRRRPIGRAVDRERLSLVVAGRAAGGAQALIGRVGIRPGVADEHVQVRFAGLARKDDRIVVQQLAGMAQEAERAQVIDRRDRRNANAAVSPVSRRLERAGIVKIVGNRGLASKAVGGNDRDSHCG